MAFALSLFSSCSLLDLQHREEGRYLRFFESPPEWEGIEHLAAHSADVEE